MGFSSLMCVTIGRVDPQVDGDRTDPFVVSSHSIGFSFNLLTNFIKVCELLPFTVQELSVF